MNDLLDMLKTPAGLDPVSDQWVENLQISLDAMPDAFVIETMRGCIVNIARRLAGAGKEPIEDDIRRILQATLESLVTATGTDDDD